MTRDTARPRLVARAVTVALWAVGSAYLLRHEWHSASPDWVVMASTPIVWGVIISLPLLAAYARRERQWLATVLIWLAAIVGSAYTLNATIGRQAAERDVAVATAEEIVKQRRTVEGDIATAKANLEAARQKCGAGKVCHEASKVLIGVYERQVAAHETKLGTLTFAAPAAGEHRIAALISLVFGLDLDTVSTVVGLLAPCLFGITLELAAFAAAMYGWHPERQHLPGPANVATLANVPGKAPATHPVIDALARAGRPLNNGELAKLMGVCDGEATKRRREVANLILTKRIGREVVVSLH